jgi:carbamoyl-phosphate synthase small subunit
MKLILADGTVIAGEAFGARRDVAGEAVFNTGLTGYVEALTDPSYRGQILILTYPMQGNYGVPRGPFESSRIQVQGLVVSQHTAMKSHHEAVRTLGEWLCAEGVPAIEGVDTRALTRHLRDAGTMDACLVEDDRNAACASRVDMVHAARDVACSSVIRVGGGEPNILVIDTGAKESIINALVRRGVTVTRAPYTAPWEDLLCTADGVVLTNGPGNPTDLGSLVERLRVVLAKGLPTLGICLGHQLLALAAGASTYKMTYGHRSQNQPVQELVTGRATITRARSIKG